jgi:tRNA pseudouridine65 synthase
MTLDILYQDDHLIAIHKPSGMFVHPTDLDRNALSCMPLLRDQLGQWVYPAHRLDRGTSGVVLFALSSEVANEIMVQFEKREVKKEYLALVRGYLQESGVIDHAYCPPDVSEPVDAVTEFSCEATVELPFAVGPYQTARYSLMKAMPKTGRQHQIRRHCAHLRHPVVGDHSYGDGKHNRFFKSQFGIARLLLMATQISFRHPKSGDEVTVVAPIPTRIELLFEQLGWEIAASRYGKGVS